MVGRRLIGSSVVEEESREGGYQANVRIKALGSFLEISEMLATEKAKAAAKQSSGYMPHEIGRVETNVLESETGKWTRDTYLISVVIVEG